MLSWTNLVQSAIYEHTQRVVGIGLVKKQKTTFVLSVNSSLLKPTVTLWHIHPLTNKQFDHHGSLNFRHTYAFLTQEKPSSSSLLHCKDEETKLPTSALENRNLSPLSISSKRKKKGWFASGSSTEAARTNTKLFLIHIQNLFPLHL